jgi:GntR family transcriptional regulator
MSETNNTNEDHLDSSSYVPLYAQLYEILRRRIEKGEYKNREKIPSETDLMNSFDVSRITALAAIRELIKTGLAYRIKGKGTFVAQSKIKGLSSFGSFSADIRQRGMVPSSKVVEFTKIPADAELQERLGVEPGELCIKLVRVRFANDEPVAIETAYLPDKLVPGIENEDLNKISLYETLENRFGLYPTLSEGIFEAAPTDRWQAELLNLKPGEPILIVHRVTFDKNYLPLEWVHSYYRADRFSFSTGRQPV